MNNKLLILNKLDRYWRIKLFIIKIQKYLNIKVIILIIIIKIGY